MLFIVPGTPGQAATSQPAAGHGDMIRLLRRSDLQVEDPQETQPSPGAATRHPLATIQ